MCTKNTKTAVNIQKFWPEVTIWCGWGPSKQ